MQKIINNEQHKPQGGEAMCSGRVAVRAALMTPVDRSSNLCFIHGVVPTHGF